MSHQHSSDISSELPQPPHVLAFYLPQFHPVPENDAWHGAGFTEWSVVAESTPLYPGHRQPDLPGELGFYDLRVPEVRYRQARLAQEHGVTGFLYYHYWFGGRRMLERPFNEVLRSGQPDFPFALCWANESWYRRWQGSNDEMVLEQVFSDEDDVAHIHWLIECFKDPRYIRIEDRPLLVVYRADQLPEPKRTVATWRRECEAAGVKPPWLVLFETRDTLPEPGTLGFDATAEFVPHHLDAITGLKPFRFGGSGSHHIYRYEEVATAYVSREPVRWRHYPCVATGWDNTPRRRNGEALILHNSTPEVYGRWFAAAAGQEQKAAGRNGIVFVNAWNEWAEGAHLEPDHHWGRAYLEKTRDVLQDLFGFMAPRPEEAPLHAAPVPSQELYHDLYERFVEQQQASSGYLAHMDRRLREMKRYYEGKLDWVRYQGQQMADMNEWLAEQLQLLTKRMNELTLPNVAPVDWLDAPVMSDRIPGDQDENDLDMLAATEDVGGQDATRSGWPSQVDHEPRTKKNGAVRLFEFDDQEAERRRDEGFDDQPGNMPSWLVDVDISEIPSKE